MSLCVNSRSVNVMISIAIDPFEGRGRLLFVFESELETKTLASQDFIPIDRLQARSPLLLVTKRLIDGV
jgi:hypothetical protein